MTEPRGDLSFRDAVVAIERGGAAFYRRIAHMVSHPRHAEVLEYLAGEEDGHARQMAQLARSESTGPELTRAFESAGDLLIHLVEENGDLEMISNALDSQEQILKLAISTEADSVLFYQLIKNYLTDPHILRDVDAVLADERRHFQTFYDLLKLTRRIGEEAPSSPDTIRRSLQDSAKKDESEQGLRDRTASDVEE